MFDCLWLAEREFGLHFVGCVLLGGLGAVEVLLAGVVFVGWLCLRFRLFCLAVVALLR